MLGAAGAAMAQDKIDLSTPAPAPAVGRSYHMHDGFYLRVNVGLGTLGTRYDDGTAANIDLDGSGLSMAADVLVGGTPSRALALGGALLTTGAFSAGFDRDGDPTGDRNMSFVLIGPFVDGFFDARGGWHIGGTLGLANVHIQTRPDEPFGNTRGLGGAAWIGHDFWVADEWSLGVLFRLAGALTQSRADDGNTSASTLGGTLMFTALYH
jgi:hypothetical protein